ncbi:MAG: UbiA prenyltransferase family protein, partial [Halobacteriaceae archaeon]
TAVGLVYELRPWQWYKQLVLFVPLVFSGSANEFDLWIRIVSGGLLFSAVAGSTYIINDVNDIDEDRQHPRKRHRPIASGQVPVPIAVAAAIGIYIVAGVLSLQLNPLFFGLIAAYVGQNFLYSYVMKKFLFVDLLSIAIGFVLRVLAGIVLISVQLSPWLFLCTFLTALMLGVSKRWGEYESIEEPDAVRENLDEYSVEILKFLFVSVATMLLMSYSLYTFFARDIMMMLTIPFAFYAVFRFAHLTLVNAGADEPVDFLFDRPMIVNLCLWGVSIVVLLYQDITEVPL